MVGSPFEVHDFSIEKLVDLITVSAADGTTPEQIAKKSHKNYFQGYFSALTVKTILVENGYTDKYYTDDFSEYYVRCFKDYKKTCTRLHFFSEDVTYEDIEGLLEGKPDPRHTEQSLQEIYLGFVVIKPLPLTVIGRTCLKTYPCDGRRYFPITRNYKVNLFGINLEAKDTLAFQEQDSVVAACATSALWSVFHGTGILFHHQILSPSQITKQATKHVPVNKRTFPNEGLTSEMMAHAIRAISLEPSLERIPNLYWLKCTLYAYMKAKIPMILGIDLYDTGRPAAQFMGKHAVAVTGYSLGLANTELNPDSSFGKLLLTASKIDKLYAHDDQVGPFSRMSFDNSTFNTSPNTTISDTLLTSFPSPEGKNDTVYAKPDILLIPLYHKIRIPFISIYRLIADFTALLNWFTNNSLPALEWDIYLNQTNDWKTEIISENILSDNDQKNLLMEKMPRFIWRAIAISNGEKELEFIFDATDIDQGSIFIRAVEYKDDLSKIISTMSNIPGMQTHLTATPSNKIFDWFHTQGTTTAP